MLPCRAVGELVGTAGKASSVPSRRSSFLGRSRNKRRHGLLLVIVVNGLLIQSHSVRPTSLVIVKESFRSFADLPQITTTLVLVLSPESSPRPNYSARDPLVFVPHATFVEVPWSP